MRESTQAVLDATAGKSALGRSKLRVNCPFCEQAAGKVDRRQCLELDLTSGWWKCYRCDSRGRIDSDDMPYDVRTLEARVSRPSDASEVPLPAGFVGLWTPEGQESQALQPALRYLQKHRVGVTPRIIKRARIGAVYKKFVQVGERWCFNPFHERVVVPIFKGPTRIGYVGRVWGGDTTLKYRYSVGFARATALYNAESLLVPTDYPAVVVEGVFDTFPFWREREARSDGVAVLGKPSSAQFDMMVGSKRPLIIAFDGDAWREGLALAMQLRLAGKDAISLHLPPGKDPDELAPAIHAVQRAFAQLVINDEAKASDTLWRVA